jgi:hypothetical protein
MTTSSRELTGPASAGTAQSAQPAKTRSGKAPAEIRRESADPGDRLADTSEALARKVDLPVRVEDAVHATKETVQAKVDEVKQHLQKSSETLRDKADEATLQAKSLTNQAVAQFPPVAGRIEQLTQTVRQRPVPAVAVVLSVVVLLVLRRLLRRNG